MKLKLKRVSPLLNALESLEAVTDEAGKRSLYRFSVKLTWNKTKNITILRRIEEEIEKTRQELVAKYSGRKSVAVPEDKKPEFIDEWNAHMDTEEEIPGLLLLPWTDLDLFDPKDNAKGNLIPSSLLSALDPLLNVEGVPS